MIAYQNLSGFTEIWYQGRPVQEVYSNTSKVWPTDTKFSATYIGGQTYTKNCDGNTELTSATTKPSGYDYSAMTEAIIGNCVTSIGDYAFSSCSTMASVTIPDSVTEIGYGAFRVCSSLTSIDIPSGVISIGTDAFGGCSGLTSMSVDANNTVYDSRNNCNAIIETATNTLLYGCQNTVIPNSVTSIAQNAFYYCTSLTSIDIPNSVTSIGERAFQGCSSLTSVTIPSGVTSIGGNAFTNCSGLQSITCLATTPPEFGRNLPFGNTNDCPIYVPCESVEAYKTANRWSSYASRIQCMSKFKFTLSDSSVVSAECDSTNQINQSDVSPYTSSVVSAEIGQCVTRIGYGAFGTCRSLTTCTIGSGVTSIGNSAFYYCIGLTSITIPNSVTYIGQYAFQVCISLTSIDIPSGVTSIGEYAFLDCRGLTSVTVEATTPPTLGSGAFDYTNDCPIYVPAASVDTYKSATNWSDYASRIQAIP